ncbi:pilus assembly PilX N-terminal domain-containing protein [Halomonas sp. M4R5S39]|uniref:pilus assembly PilX family protein n=1 Tax=Halomonas kalidii TaxID=3043293 RepID=UPI0024A861DE|nr:pilus assembly PilX N-terminal domain-containing protein [Halomonas kalidii]MDI5983513.1 pilus assembly PilX N-terminal domain-containing protein [Halomonas kalidii]
MKKRQRGSALIVSLVLVTAALMVGVSGMQSAQIEESASGNRRAAASAYMAAEYGGDEALNTVSFASLGNGTCTSGSGNVGNTQAVVSYSYDACKSSGGGIATINAQGSVGGVVREVVIEYILSSGFLGLSPINLPTPLSAFNAANSNAFVVEGQISSGGDGGHLPAISTAGNRDDVLAEIGDREDNYSGGISDSISESILQDPVAFESFITEVKSVADGSGRTFSASSDVDTYGTTTLDGSPDAKLTYIDGDFTVSGNWSGRGLLVVNGDFDVSGTPYFEGLVIVLGNNYSLSGGGDGGINGAMIAAPIDSSASTLVYDSANVTVSGGGNADYAYDGEALDDAFELLSGTSAETMWNTQNVSTHSSYYVSSWREVVD